jgi:hypothetical protein
MGVIETDDAFYKMNIGLFDNEVGSFQKVAKADENRFINLAKDLDSVQIYLWFAEFPVPGYRRENGNHIVEFYDLRFGVVPNKTPFLLRVTFDENGSLKSIYLNGRFVKEKLS